MAASLLARFAAGRSTPKARRSINVDGSEAAKGETSDRASPSASVSATTSATSPHNMSMRKYRQRALKDYQVMLEFRHLKLHSPSGIYILPSFNSLRQWSGVLFVRRGIYKGGIFRFEMVLPRSYPADGACPRVKFQTPIFHPHVDPKSGEVDILSHFGGKWVAGEHYIVLVLQVMKTMMEVTSQKDLSLGFSRMSNRTKIVRKKDESGLGESGNDSENNSNTSVSKSSNSGSSGTRKDGGDSALYKGNRRGSGVLNPAALKLWQDVNGPGRLEYLKRAKSCGKDSIEHQYDNPEGSVIRFTRPIKQHESMMHNLVKTGSIRGSPFVMSPKVLAGSPQRRSSSSNQSKKKHNE